MPASIKDVAARAGVSTGTVSNVLNRPHLVSAATRAKVSSAIDELDFVRSEPARQLRAGSSRAIAYLMLDASNPFFMDVARGIEDVARSHELAVYLVTTDNDQQREAEYYDLLLQQRVRGVLVTPLDAQNPRLSWLVKQGVPVVLVDRRGDGSFCSVTVNDEDGASLAISHLLENGHRKIVFVGGPHSLPQVQDRLSGSRRAVREAGLDPGVLSLMPTSALSVAGGREAGQRLAGLPARRRPTAAFCANDLVALGLLQEMTQLSIRVPQDLSIIGYDDIDFAAAAAVPLTSVRQPRELLGRTAVDLLLAESSDEAGHQHRQVVFEPELIVRASSGAARGTSRSRSPGPG